MLKKMLVFLLLAVLAAPAAWAHNAWVEKTDEGYVVLYGHGERHDPYKPEYVKEAKAYDASGAELGLKVTKRAADVLLSPSKAPAVITLVFDSGYYVKTPEGSKKISKRQAKKAKLDVLASVKSIKYSKNFWQWGDRFKRPLGEKMEIVPLKNPLALKVGQTLPIQALYKGKPLVGAAVRVEGEKEEMKTDKDGKAEVPIRKSGQNLVKVSLKIPTPHDPDADTLSQSACITFEVK